MWETAFEYFLVGVVAAFAGGWTIPVGVALGLQPIGVFVAAWIGTVLATVLWMVFGGRGRDAMVDRFGGDVEDRVADSRAMKILDRWGIAGLSTVGLVVAGPTLTMLTVLIAGLDRRKFVVWSSIATFGIFAALTVFWSLVL